MAQTNLTPLHQSPCTKFGFSGVSDSDFLNPLVRGALIGKKAGSTDTALPAHSIRDGFLDYSSFAA